MGCTISRQARRDRRLSPSRFERSYSMPVRRRGESKGERYHVVSLKSSTLGSLKLDRADPGGSSDEEMMKSSNDRGREVVDQAKAWSEMIERRIPRTPTRTPPNEPETINAWELMAGLDDASPLPRLSPAAAGRCFSFSAVRGAGRGLESVPKNKSANGSPTMVPLWMQTAPENSIVSDFDPEVISTFRKALEELSPQHPYLLRSPEPEKMASQDQLNNVGNGRITPKFAGIVKARITAFQERIDARKASFNASTAKVAPSCKCPPGGEGKVVFYFTSLRGVRKTYEDCWAVRVILQGYGVKVDERDVSMHGGFKDELNEVLGVGHGGSRLPRVFAGERYLGGAEEIRQMHEAGELGKAFEGCETVTVGKGGAGGQCEGCGDLRFVPCESCSGSCKVFVEEEEGTGGFRRCPECNENGLVRCPLCC